MAESVDAEDSKSSNWRQLYEFESRPGYSDHAVGSLLAEYCFAHGTLPSRDPAFLDLYACIRPVRYFEGVGSPMKEPEKLNVVIFRETTEDVYAGIEWRAGSPEANEIIEFIRTKFKKDIREKSAIGIKPMSEFGSRRLVNKGRRVTYDLARQMKGSTVVSTTAFGNGIITGMGA